MLTEVPFCSYWVLLKQKQKLSKSFFITLFLLLLLFIFVMVLWKECWWPWVLGLPATQKASQEDRTGTWLDLLGYRNHPCFSFNVNTHFPELGKLHNPLGRELDMEADLPQPCLLLSRSHSLYWVPSLCMGGALPGHADLTGCFQAGWLLPTWGSCKELLLS